MPAKKYWYITQTNLINQLSKTELQMLGGACIFKQFKKKDLIFAPSDPAQRIYVLEQGTVTLYQLSPEGKKIVLDVLTPVTMFGDVSFLYDKVQDHYAEASSDVQLCVIPKDSFLTIIERRPEFALKLLEITSARLREAESRMRDMAIADAKSRILNQLTRLAERNPDANTAETVTIAARLTHETLAHMVGLTRETTTKVLNDLERDGIITRGEQQTIVIHTQRARAAAA